MGKRTRASQRIEALDAEYGRHTAAEARAAAASSAADEELFVVDAGGFWGDTQHTGCLNRARIILPFSRALLTRQLHLTQLSPPIPEF